MSLVPATGAKRAWAGLVWDGAQEGGAGTARPQQAAGRSVRGCDGAVGVKRGASARFLVRLVLPPVGDV